MNSDKKTCRTSKWRCDLKNLTSGLRESVSGLARKLATRLKETEAAELLEFALALPLILVMVAGLLDFSRAYTIKQKLSNAAREGARLAATETRDISQSNPPSMQTFRDDVVTYLNNADINTSFIGTTLSYSVAPPCTGTYYTTVGTNNYGLRIDRCLPVMDTATSTTIGSSRVTLYYPYDWTFGFDHIIKLLLPSSTFTSPIRIETDATISNFVP